MEWVEIFCGVSIFLVVSKYGYKCIFGHRETSWRSSAIEAIQAAKAAIKPTKFG